MEDESKQILIERLKNRFNGITDKFNVHVYKEIYSKENASLILFSEFLKKAIEGINYIIENSFDDSNQYKNEEQIISLVSHIYNSSLLYYSKMFRGGAGVERENLELKENKLFNSDGNVKKQNSKKDRFYIEEFFNHNSHEFKNHHEILFQVDKSIVHTDKTDLTKCYTILIFDKEETQKYLGIDNHFEYFQLPNYPKLIEFLSLFKNIQEQLNNRINKNATIVHNNLKNKNSYNSYYDDLIINENEDFTD